MEDKRSALPALLGAMAAIGVDFSRFPMGRSSKDDGRPRQRALSSDDYVVDWHGSIRRNFEKSPSKKIRARAKRMAKRKALADQIPF